MNICLLMNIFLKILAINRYCVRLPFKEIKEIIPENFFLAKHRLRYFKKRLDKNPDVLNTYNEIIKDYLNKGIIEKVSHLSKHKDPGTVYYLPHQAVIKKIEEQLNSALFLMLHPKLKTSYP